MNLGILRHWDYFEAIFFFFFLSATSLLSLWTVSLMIYISALISTLCQLVANSSFYNLKNDLQSLFATAVQSLFKHQSPKGLLFQCDCPCLFVISKVKRQGEIRGNKRDTLLWRQTQCASFSSQYAEASVWRRIGRETLAWRWAWVANI